MVVLFLIFKKCPNAMTLYSHKQCLRALPPSQAQQHLWPVDNHSDWNEMESQRSFLFFIFLREGISVQPWLLWNPLCGPGWSRTQRCTCLCFLSFGIKGVRHHCSTLNEVLNFISLIVEDVEYFCKYVLAIVFFGELSIQLIGPFNDKIICFLWCLIFTVLYILQTIILPDVQLAKILFLL